MEKEYRAWTDVVLEEHRRVFEQMDTEELEQFVRRIAEARRVFVLGAGREGISARGFAMRLAHLGKAVHWVWDDTTPAMGSGDVFLVVDGRGGIGSFCYLLERAKASGAHIAMVTAQPDGANAVRFADSMLFVRAAVYCGNRKDVVQTQQPMGNLFEQHIYMLFDIMAILLKDRMRLTYEQMESRHRNIE